jgi:hypothetical protein
MRARVELMGPALSEDDLADPERDVDAAMDHRIPRSASTELLHCAQRCLFRYIAWLYEEALPRYPSWAKDEVNRAVGRLVELRGAARAARPARH